MKTMYTLPVGFECYKLGDREICVRRSSCYFCDWCKLIAYDRTNNTQIIQCSHYDQWKKEDLTDKGIVGKCPKFEEKLEELNNE